MPVGIGGETVAYIPTVTNDASAYIGGVNLTPLGDASVTEDTASGGTHVFDLDGSGDAYSATPNSNFVHASKLSVSFWFKTPPVMPPADFVGLVGIWDTGAQQRSWSFYLTETPDKVLRFAVDQTGSFTTYSARDSPDLAANTWYHVVGRFDAGAISLHINNSTAGTSPIGWSSATSIKTDSTSDFLIGGHRNNGVLYRELEGRVGDVRIFAGQSISTTKISDLYGGGTGRGKVPKPLNTVAPALSGTETVGETLTSTTGTWDSQSNGTITYEYQWTRSNDGSGTGEADISGATSSAYTLQAADEGKYIRCRVRASNDGGYDAAEDTESGFTGAIAAGGSSITGSASITLDGVTASSSAASHVNADSAATLDGVTASAVASARAAGVAVVSLDGVTASSSASSRVNADSALALDGVTTSAIASSNVAGSASITLDGVTVFASTSDGSIGNAAISLDGVTAVSVASSDVFGDGAITLDGVSSLATASSVVAADATVTLNGVTVTSQALWDSVGIASIMLDGVTVTATVGGDVIDGTAFDLFPDQLFADQLFPHALT